MKKNKTLIAFMMYQVITGGIEKCLLTIIENLHEYDKYKFVVITKREITSNFFLNFFKKYNVEVITLPDIESIGDKPKKLFSKIIWKIKRKKIKNKIKEILKYKLYSADIIIDYFNISFWNELKDINIPKIAFWHASTMMFQKYYTNVADTIMKTYSKFVCLTEETMNDLTKLYPKYRDKLIHIYNPFNIEKIRQLAITGDYPQDNKKYFTFLGRFHEDKDHICVIKAVELLYKKYPDLKVYFIGEGPFKNEYVKIINSKGLENNIIFTGVLDNPYGYLKNAAANILSSPSEGLSTVLIEAQILGTLNISSETPSCAREILLNGKGGLLFPIGDYKKLAEHMEKIYTDNIDINGMIKESTNALNRFDSKHVINNIDNLITQMKEESGNNTPA